MTTVAKLIVQDVLADRRQTTVESVSERFGVLIEIRLVRIKLIAAPVLHVRHVRHDDIRAGQNAQLASVILQGLQGRRRGDVDVVEIEARHGDHLESEAKPSFPVRRSPFPSAYSPRE